MPDLLLFLKLIHILAVILMVGATIFNGVIHARAHSSTSIEAVALLVAYVLGSRSERKLYDIASDARELFQAAQGGPAIRNHNGDWFRMSSRAETTIRSQKIR